MQSARFRRVPVTASTLAAVELFQPLEPAHRERIAAACEGRIYPPRVTVINHNDASRDVYFLVSGRAQVTVFSPSGKVITFQDLRAGDMFGELAAIDGEPRSASVVTAVESFLVRYEWQPFVDLIWEDRGVGEVVLRRLTHLARFLCGRVFDFHSLPVKHRIRAELLRLVEIHDVDGGRAVIDPAPTQEDVAGRAGTTREAVSTEYADLRGNGVITTHPGRLEVHDVDRLRRMVDEVRAG